MFLFIPFGVLCIPCVLADFIDQHRSTTFEKELETVDGETKFKSRFCCSYWTNWTKGWNWGITFQEAWCCETSCTTTRVWNFSEWCTAIGGKVRKTTTSYSCFWETFMCDRGTIEILDCLGSSNAIWICRQSRASDCWATWYLLKAWLSANIWHKYVGWKTNGDSISWKSIISPNPGSEIARILFGWIINKKTPKEEIRLYVSNV